ncbi:MAG TPA: hypothetical protein VMF87_06930 [Streptosporangiaceae bacterium]|nr:hypothetical protein [Streptosporangiaceae bacterium]
MPGSNPVYDDLALFEIYMGALDEVIANPEIRAAIDEFRISPHTVRMKMIGQARRVLEGAPQEFAAYEAARGTVGQKPEVEAVHFVVRDPFRVRRWILPSRFHGPASTLRMFSGWSGGAGCLLAGAGLATIRLWPWTDPLLWAGGTLFTLAVLLLAGAWLVDNGLRLIYPASFWVPDDNPELGPARDALMTAVGGEELLAQARTVINIARQDQYGHAYSVANISGLSETYDGTYQVPTVTAAELDRLIGRLDGASIGVAGPRGSGKSTLIRGYCDDRMPAWPGPSERNRSAILYEARERHLAAGGDLRCMVSAPVDYAASDFVLHLFAAFCQSVIKRFDAADDSDEASSALALLYELTDRLRWSFWRVGAYLLLFAVPAAVLLHWQSAIAGYFRIPTPWVYYTGIAAAVLGIVPLARAPGRRQRRTVDLPFRYGLVNGPELVSAARRHLAHVRYLQTTTSGWSGNLTFPAAGAQYSRAVAQAEQPLTYPEIVAEFRAFARDVAAKLHYDGDRTFVGIDELDKIGAPEQAERFLNEIKGIFGIPHLYFMVSVSDDALTSFERRGLPLRDAFDSSFDEIIHVGPLSYVEARRLLYRRVIGLTEPYVAFCHCLAGGLARDLVRAARQLGRAGEMTGGDARLALADLDGVVDPDLVPAFRLLYETGPQPTPTLSGVCAAVVREELRRKARAVIHAAASAAPGQGRDLQDTLNHIGHGLAADEPAIKIVDLVGRSAAGEPDSIAGLRFDFAAYAYYLATLQEVFTDKLDRERFVKASDASGAPGTFDALAQARDAFTIDAQLAWRSITAFRQAWTLEIRTPGG